MWNNRNNLTKAHLQLPAIVLCTCLSAGVAYAQSDTETDEVEKAQEVQASTDPDQNQIPPGNGGFTPSEEISEDLSVSFPVDI